MWKFQGTINGTVDSIAKNLPMVIKNYRLVNVSAGSVNVNVYMISGANNYSVGAYPQTISAGGLYEDSVEMLMSANESVRLVTTGTVDYLFNIENTEPETD